MYTHAQDINALIMLWFVELALALASLSPHSGLTKLERLLCVGVFTGTTMYLIKDLFM